MIAMQLFNKYWWDQKYWQVRGFFIPQQRWLTKKIPNTYCDKVELVPTCLFEILVRFVEDEMGNVSWDWQDEVGKGFVSQEQADHTKQVAADIRAVYQYIKFDRPALEKEIENSYPPDNDDWLKLDTKNPKIIGNITLYHQIDKRTEEQKQHEKNCYEKINYLENQLNEKDDWALHKIIDLRESLWT